MNKLDNTEKGLTLIERVLELVKKYSLFDFLKSLFLIILIATVIGLITNPDYFITKYQEWHDKEHSEKLELRLKNNQQLHTLSEKLLYRLNADRVLIMEMHNGVSSNSGLPFAKASATYEAINEGVAPVAGQYQEMNLSLMPFATELLKNGYWCGDTEELKQIDRALCYKMLGNDTSHFAGCVIRGVDKPIAFILVKFKHIHDDHSCEEVQKVITDNALQLALLLELNKAT